MIEVTDKALTMWGLEGAFCQLIAARENQVYRVDKGGVSYALRLHRSNYRTDTELESELAWLTAIASRGLDVPKPIQSLTGTRLHRIAGVQVDLLTWLSGRPIGKTGSALKVPDRLDVFSRIGSEMAHLHNVSDDWTPPRGFVRCHWDRDGLLGDTPLWGRFWENPSLSVEDKQLLVRTRDAANTHLAGIEETLDYGLIHADLVRENILLDGNRVQMIDFDDAGYGFRLFDLATFLFKNRSEPDFDKLQAACIEGYASHRQIDLAALDLFVVLRALTYVGWIVSRMKEPQAALRNARFLRDARQLSTAYLATQGA